MSKKVGRKKTRRRSARKRREGDKKAAAAVQLVTARAVRRLNVVEYLLLAAAGVLSLAAGAVAALGLRALAGFSFRPTWAVVSLVFFVVPGVMVFGRERRARHRDQLRTAESLLKENDG